MRKLSKREPETESEIVIKKKRAPGATLQSRENRLISKSLREAELQIDERTVSSQVLTHFLKLGTTREQLEKAKIENENLLLKARVEAINSQKKMDILYEKAIIAMGTYKGEDVTLSDD